MQKDNNPVITFILHAAQPSILGHLLLRRLVNGRDDKDSYLSLLNGSCTDLTFSMWSGGYHHLYIHGIKVKDLLSWITLINEDDDFDNIHKEMCYLFQDISSADYPRVEIQIDHNNRSVTISNKKKIVA